MDSGRVDGATENDRGGQASGIILAGGRSLRMGADKALLEIEGETLLERTVRVFRTVFDEVVVVGPNRPITDLDATVVPDEHPGFGPLAGLITGLSSISCDWAFVTGCDMPHLSSDAIKYLLTVERSGAEAIVPVISGIAQPLHAVYARRVLPKLRAEWAQGGRPLTGALRRLDVAWVTEECFRQLCSGLQSFVSVNTPEEWQRMVVEPRAHKQMPEPLSNC